MFIMKFYGLNREKIVNEIAKRIESNGYGLSIIYVDSKLIKDEDGLYCEFLVNNIYQKVRIQQNISIDIDNSDKYFIKSALLFKDGDMENCQFIFSYAETEDDCKEMFENTLCENYVKVHNIMSKEQLKELL